MLAADRFAGLLQALELTPLERRESLAACAIVRDHLRRSTFGSLAAVETRFIGAWDKGTETRPPRDIDVLLALSPSAEVQHFGTRNKSLEILLDVKQSLMDLWPETRLRRDGRAVVVPCPAVSVGVLAGFSRGAGLFDVCDASTGGRHRTINPDAEKGALEVSDRRTTGSTRALVRLMRTWQRYRGVPVASLGIELAAVAFLSTWKHALDGPRYYDWMVRDMFADLITRASSTVAVPGVTDRLAMGHKWVPLAEVAYGHAVRACDLETLGRDRDAWWEWEQIFGDAVPFDR